MDSPDSDSQLDGATICTNNPTSSLSLPDTPTPQVLAWDSTQVSMKQSGDVHDASKNAPIQFYDALGLRIDSVSDTVAVDDGHSEDPSKELATDIAATGFHHTEGKEKTRISPCLGLTVLVASIPAMVDGFNLVVVNNSVVGVLEYFKVLGKPVGHDEWSTFVAIFLAGSICGALISGPMINRVGPKRVLQLNDIVNAVGAVLYLTGSTYGVLCVARTLNGIAMGMNIPSLQILIQECSPTPIRGLLSMIVLTLTNAAMLLGYSLGMTSVMGSAECWKYLYTLPLVFVVAHFFASWFVPESPRWLMGKGRVKEAENALRRLRHGTEDCTKELAVMKDSMEAQQIPMGQAAKTLFTSRAFVIPLILGNVIPLLVQFTAGSFIALYSRTLFTGVGFENGELATVLVGVVTLLGRILTVATIEPIGRKWLLVFGWSATAVLGVLFGIASIYSKIPAWNKAGFALFLLYVLIGSLPGGVSIMLPPELFPNHLRSVAVGVCNLTARVGTFIGAKSFLYMMNGLGNYLFFLFAGISLVGVVFIGFVMPETKGVPLEDVQELFERSRWGDRRKEKPNHSQPA